MVVLALPSAQPLRYLRGDKVERHSYLCAESDGPHRTRIETLRLNVPRGVPDRRQRLLSLAPQGPRRYTSQDRIWNFCKDMGKAANGLAIRYFVKLSKHKT